MSTPLTMPYPGLRPFEAEDQPLFFGREEQVSAMLRQLEDHRFVAVVGSSGSGKSSLVRAGLLPAVREGFLLGTTDWRTLVIKPGHQPYQRLVRALHRTKEDAGNASAIPADDGPLTSAETLTLATLRRTDRGLLTAVDELAMSSENRIMVVVDQFEELFAFRRAGVNRDHVASRDEAAAFVGMLLRSAADPAGRVWAVLTMRSDFIGDCEAFLGLPEQISRSQFLVPRPDRRQMEEAIARPGTVEEGAFKTFTFADGLVNRIVNDAGDRPDQLPLMQHALMRTWKRALERSGTGGPVKVTFDDYETAGGIENALSLHADAAWNEIKDDPKKAHIARRLFLLLCDISPDGQITRRRPQMAEVQAVTSASVTEIESVVRVFQQDDRNFLLPPPPQQLTAETYLDISHEALLRQWKEFSHWLTEEADSKVWLQELSQAAKDYQRDPQTELWRGNDLRNGEEWMRKTQPTEAWANRHGVRNWDACLRFLDRSGEAALFFKRELEAKAQLEQEKKRQAQEEKDALQKKLLTTFGAIAMSFFLMGAAMTFLWSARKESEQRAEKASAARLASMQAISLATVPMMTSGKAALSSAEEQTAEVTEAIRKAATEPPPDKTVTDQLLRARTGANEAVDAIEKLAQEIEKAALTTDDQNLSRTSEDLAVDVREVRTRQQALQNIAGAQTAVRQAIGSRLEVTEKALAGLLGREPLDRTVAKEKAAQLLAARANLEAIYAIQDAGLALGFQRYDDPFAARIVAIAKTLAAARSATEGAPTGTQLPFWKPEPQWKPENGFTPLAHGGRVNRVRFAPNFPAEAPLLVAACEDREVYFWQKDGTLRGVVAGTNAVNDVVFSPQGDALAAASNGSTVRLLRWPNAAALEPFKRANFKVFAFERHSDSITDVEFSHGGERVASASADRTVRVFDSRSIAQLYFTSPPLPGIVTSVAFHRGDNLVVSGCDDGGVRLHTIDQPAVQLLGKFDAPARRPEFSADGKYVVAASGDKTARVWPIVQPKEIVRIAHDASVTQATFRPVADPQNYPFVTTATNGEVRLVTLSDITPSSANYPSKALEPRHPGSAVSATWSADGRWLATVGGGEVILWEWLAAEPTARLRITDLHPATSRAEFSPDARLLVTYGGDHLAFVWDLTKLPGLHPLNATR